MRAVACPVVRGVVAPHGLDAHRKSRDASAAVRPRARRGAMSSPRRARCAPAVAADGASAASASSTPAPFTRADLDLLLRAVELSAGSDGLTQPHPKSGCVPSPPPTARWSRRRSRWGRGRARGAARRARRRGRGARRGGVPQPRARARPGGRRARTRAGASDAGVRFVEIGVALYAGGRERAGERRRAARRGRRGARPRRRHQRECCGRERKRSRASRRRDGGE